MAKGDGTGYHFDMIDQLLILLLGLMLLAGNFGWISPSFMAYWPLVLVVIALKSIMYHR